MNKPMLIVIALFVGLALFDLIAELLNLKAWSPALPSEFEGFYDAQRYAASQKYLADSTVLALIKSGAMLVLLVCFMLFGGFDFLDNLARGLWGGAIGRGLIFAGVLFLALFLFNLPFEAYDTFVIEAKYGFNRTTPQTFAADTLKSFLLNGILGGLVLAGVLWLFEKGGVFAWFYAWLALALFQILIMYLAPAVIMPLFNKFSPLEEGKLKTEIEQLAQKEDYKVKGIYVMDGSKRSTKANAALTGFGKLKRIMLYDTLIKQLDENEITAVLAHEIGHYKFKHVVKFIFLSLGVSLVVFFVFSRSIHCPWLFKAFGMQNMSIYAGLVCFMLLLAPFQRLESAMTNRLSRFFEYQADAFAARATGNPDPLIAALKKLSAESMSNLKPHPPKRAMPATQCY